MGEDLFLAFTQFWAKNRTKSEWIPFFLVFTWFWAGKRTGGKFFILVFVVFKFSEFPAPLLSKILRTPLGMSFGIFLCCKQTKHARRICFPHLSACNIFPFDALNRTFYDVKNNFNKPHPFGNYFCFASQFLVENFVAWQNFSYVMQAINNRTVAFIATFSYEKVSRLVTNGGELGLDNKKWVGLDQKEGWFRQPPVRDLFWTPLLRGFLSQSLGKKAISKILYILFFCLIKMKSKKKDFFKIQQLFLKVFVNYNHTEWVRAYLSQLCQKRKVRPKISSTAALVALISTSSVKQCMTISWYWNWFYVENSDRY